MNYHFANRMQYVKPSAIRHADKEGFSAPLLFEHSFGYAAKGEVMIYSNQLMRIVLVVN